MSHFITKCDIVSHFITKCDIVSHFITKCDIVSHFVTEVTFVTGLIWIPPGGVYMDFLWTLSKNTVGAEYLWYTLGLGLGLGFRV
jgi:hypothetical protein